jgi:hypothetical protein
MNIIKTIFGTIVIIASLSLLISRCSPSGETSGKYQIEQIKNNPGRLHNKIVTTRGVVTDRFILGGIGYYTLAHKEASVLVLTNNGAPALKEKIEVTGKLNQGLAVKGLEQVGIIEQSRRSIK